MAIVERGSAKWGVAIIILYTKAGHNSEGHLFDNEDV